MARRYTLGDKLALDEAFNRLLSSGGGLRGSFYPDVFTSLFENNVDVQTTIYVETTGNDGTATGSSFAPFKTPQAAIDYANSLAINQPVLIQLGVGDFEAFAVSRPTLTSNGSLTIMGTYATTGITGTATVAVSGAICSFTDAGKSWTVDQHVGRILKFTQDAGASYNYAPIGSNTATALVVPLGLGAGSATYEILDYGTTITGSAPTFRDVYSSSDEGYSTSSGSSNILIFGTSDGQIQNANLQIMRLKVTSTTSAIPISIRGTNNVQITQCHIARTSTAGVLMSSAGSGQISVVRNYFGGITTSTCFSQITAGVWTGVAMNTNVMNGGTTGINISSGALGVTTGMFRNLTTGISITAPATSNLISLCQFNSCTTGILVNRQAQTALTGCQFDTGTTAVSATNMATIFWSSTGSAISNYTNGILVTTGGTAQCPSSLSFTSVTNQLSVDAVASTAAAMRALTPKVFPGTPNAYGSYVYE